MIISTITPCRNEKHHIWDFLDSLLRQTLEPGWTLEVLIADGESDDGTREILDEYARRVAAVRVVDNPGRIVSKGLNAALKQAKGEIIIRMDAHTTYAEDYLRECVRVLQESGADNVGGPWIANGQGLWGKATAAAFRSPFCCGGGRAHDPDYEGEVDTVYLGCWRRSVFNRIGLFDPNLVRNQDDEFNFRLVRSGGKIWQSPRIRSSYVTRSSVKRLFQQYLQYGFWKVAVIRKHRGLASWRHAVPALFVTSILLALLAIILAASLGLTTVLSIGATLAATELAVYAIASFIAALVCGRSLAPTTMLLLPSVFAIYHVAYGLGFLMGMASPAKPEGDRSEHGSMFTALTR
jgi:glycosyltransferase involved in cell wall biosynthesis